MSAKIFIVNIKETSLSDDKIIEVMKTEFEVPDDEIDLVLSDVKELINQLLDNGKIEVEECVPLFSICHYSLKEFIIQEYDVQEYNSIILNINHITGKVH